MSRDLLMAVVAIEDSRFFQHIGFDLVRIGKIFHHLLTGQKVYFGASTITQQLSKTVLLSPARTIKRKLLELVSAVFLELHYSKADILEIYLNSIFFGKGSYGVEAAAQNYFGKSAKDINLPEAAILAALIKKPEGYSPLNDVRLTRERQVIVLKRLLQLGWIDQAEYTKALAAKVTVLTSFQHRRRAPYFVSSIMQQLKQKYGQLPFYNRGLGVYTTLDWVYQNVMDRVVAQSFSQAEPKPQVASLIIESKTGQVRALVGGRSFRASQFNRATQARRPPGSAIKPFLYSLAFESGWQPEHTFTDEPIAYLNQRQRSLPHLRLENEVYEPQNFDHRYRGEITLAEALQSSNNVVSVNLLHQLGLAAYQDFMQGLDLNVTPDQGLCLALGCNDVSLLN